MNRLTTFSLLTAGLVAAGSTQAATIALNTVSFSAGDTTGSAPAVDGIIVTATAGTTNATATDVALLLGATGNLALGVTSSANTDWRIDSDANGTEFLELSFNVDVTLDALPSNAGWNGSDTLAISSTAFDGLTGYNSGDFTYDDGTDTITWTGGNSVTFGTDGNSVLTIAAGTVVRLSDAAGAGFAPREITVTEVPEPGSLALLGLGGLLIARRRRG